MGRARKPFGLLKRPGTGVRNVMIQLARKVILGRTKARLDLWEEHLKDPIVALAKALECLDNPS